MNDARPSHFVSDSRERIAQFEAIELLLHWIFMAQSLEEQIVSSTALVGVVGLGYVGLPLVRVFADAGFRVLGFDTDAAKIEELQAGRSYIGDVPSEWIASRIWRAASSRRRPT